MHEFDISITYHQEVPGKKDLQYVLTPIIGFLFSRMTTKQKTLRILITPNVPCPYDQRMVKELAGGFNRIGHYAAALSAPQSAAEIAKMCESFSIDVVLQINRTRDPEVPLPPHIRHIAWYQDVFPETLEGFTEGFHDSDILYALGDPGVLGLNAQLPCYVGSLVTGVDQTTLDFKCQDIAQNLDFSLCGGLPPSVNLRRSIVKDILWVFDLMIRKVPLLERSKVIWLMRKILFGRRLPVNHVPYSAMLAMADIAESFYRPLRGELDIHALAGSMRQQITLLDDLFGATPAKSSHGQPGKLSMLCKPYTKQFQGRDDLAAKLVRYLAGESSFLRASPTSAITRAISYFSQSYPRIMDREALVKAASEVSNSLELYGPGLDTHEFARPFFKGVIDAQSKLLEVYCRTKINLSNNTHGLGLHSRTFECMAVGGFIFMHESPHDNKAGGMLTSFEPGVHYGSYTPENFAEEAARWLKDDNGRRQAGLRAKSVIRERHCWHHRAQQIIDDLER